MGHPNGQCEDCHCLTWDFLSIMCSCKLQVYLLALDCDIQWHTATQDYKCIDRSLQRIAINYTMCAWHPAYGQVWWLFAIKYEHRTWTMVSNHSRIFWKYPPVRSFYSESVGQDRKKMISTFNLLIDINLSSIQLVSIVSTKNVIWELN